MSLFTAQVAGFGTRLVITIALILLITFSFPQLLQSQQFQNRGWFYLSHSNTIKGPVSFFGELQFRSADKLGYLNTILLRGGLNYEISKDKHKVGIGYVFKGDKELSEDVDYYERTRENRIYEQYIFTRPLGSNELQIRGRLEQRFIQQPGNEHIFSQRARFLVSVTVPLNGKMDFSQGWFVVAQDELMSTIQNQQQLSGSWFDQNRLYGSIGYRFSKEVSLETGYMYWLQRDDDALEHRNIYQLKITTDF